MSQKKPLKIGACVWGVSGQRVLASIRSSADAIISVLDDSTNIAELTPISDVILSISFSPFPLKIENIADYAFDQGIRFLPVLFEGPIIAIGPLVAPGMGPCWRCCGKRKLLTDPFPAGKLQLREYYESDPESMASRFLESDVLLAADRTLEYLAHSPLRAIFTTTWTYNSLTTRIDHYTQVGLDDCERCGLHRSSAERTWQSMSDAVGDLVRDGSMRAKDIY